MRTPGPLVHALFAVTLVVLTACASPRPAADRADDPVDRDTADDTSSPMPTTVPPPEGRVGTRPPGTATVVERDGEVFICLGPVAESAPPQCDGIPVAGWSWEQAGMFQRTGGARWGDYAVAGTFDGTTVSVDDVVPLALYSPVRPEERPLPAPRESYDAGELREIARDLRALPGYLQSALTGEGHVTVSVVHDDGTLQTWADETYGEGVVVVLPALVPVDGSGAVS